MKKQSFLKGSAILAAMVVITKTLGLLYKIPLANILGGTGMGYFSAAFTVFTPVYALAASGITSAMSRQAAENRALGRFKNLRKQRRVAYALFGPISLGAALGMAVSAGPVSRVLLGMPAVSCALLCLAPSVLFCSLMNVERGYCEGQGDMLPTAVSEIAETFFKLLLGLGAALLVRQKLGGGGEDALPYIAAAAVLGSSAASALAYLGLFIGVRLRGDGITEKMLTEDPVTDSAARHRRALLSISFPIAVGTVITTLTSMLDMLTMTPCIRRAGTPPELSALMELGVSREELPTFLYGSYEGMAMLIYGLVPTLTAMFGKSILPVAVDDFAKGRRLDLGRDLNRMLSVSALTSIPAGFGITALAEPVLRSLFPGRPAEVAAAAPSLRILGIAVIFFSLSLPCFTVLQALGRAGKVTFIMLTGAAVKLVLNLLLIPVPVLNLKGAAYAELLSSAFVCIAALRELKKLTGCRPDLAETYIRPIYAGAMCAVFADLIYKKLSVSGLGIGEIRAVTALAIAGGCIMYFFSLYLLCETPKNIIKYVFSEKVEKRT
ncbi:MAG: polysaccharide biosynthesis C-terminal domain-containing protein [Ruminococcus sp.]|nr:polysaccharide biosynthesis C-terminal domain-containing protein [Ruminococcus sp.]